MRIDALQLENEGKLVADYRRHEDIMQFFEYPPFQPLTNRLEELKKRTFQRDQLVDILKMKNAAWGAGQETLERIKELKNPDTVVVVGGQQAGLLTGPLYTINKIISILQFAEKQERALGVPVLPVFWIAGEDHDYEEINHIYLPQKDKLKKFTFNQPVYKKTPISQVLLDKKRLKKWLDQLFAELPETVHTEEIHHMVTKAAVQSESFTDFFAILIHALFQEEGIILLDAADERIRRIENGYFIRLIENNQKITRAVFETYGQLLEKGYSPTFDPEPADGHLFYHWDNERILLKRTETGAWKGKNDEIELSTEQLLETAENHPENLSNNVITRPLMQEMLLPVLAFIGGPGEISYWSLLKQAFSILDLNMPPVIPRLSFTFVPEKVRKALMNTGIPIESALNNGVEAEKIEWFENKQSPPIAEIADELKRKITEAHRPIQDLAKNIRDDVGALSEKNLTYLHREVDFLRNRMIRALEEKYKHVLDQYDLIQSTLHPENGLQERIWNVLPFLNKYGMDVIGKLTRSSFSFEKQHYIVYL
mgnify:FL=1